MDADVSARDVLRKFVQLAMQACTQAETKCVRRGYVIALLIAIAVAARRKTKSAQFRFVWVQPGMGGAGCEPAQNDRRLTRKDSTKTLLV
jgi:hypothetical protein